MPSSSSASGSSSPSLTGQLFSYYYNGVASIAQAVSGESKLTDSEPCTVMGRLYCGPQTTQWATESVRCLPYFTYRRGFTQPLANGTDHDAGWGCMIRTGQMMLCQALRRLYRCDPLVSTDPLEFTLLRQPSASSGSSRKDGQQSPRRTPDPTDLVVLSKQRNDAAVSDYLSNRDPILLLLSPDTGTDAITTTTSTTNTWLAPTAPPSAASPRTTSAAGDLFCESSSTVTTVTDSGTFWCIQDLFQDVASAPFGIHSICNEGAKLGVPVGSWFSATVLGKSIRSLSKTCETVNSRLHVELALDGMVSETDILTIMDAEERSVLLLVPLMLGITSIAKSNESVFLSMLDLPASVGIVGGRPSRSYYFVGHQQDHIFYLDPHVVQPAFVSRRTAGNISGPRGTIPLQSLDPSMLVCFLFDGQESFLAWCDSMAVINKQGEFPVITIKSQVDTTGPASTRAFSGNSPTHAAAVGDDFGVVALDSDCDYDDI